MDDSNCKSFSFKIIINCKSLFFLSVVWCVYVSFPLSYSLFAEECSWMQNDQSDEGEKVDVAKQISTTIGSFLSHSLSLSL